MPVIEGRDYVMSKNAYYFDGGLIQQSGVLIVTRNMLILNVIQTVDPKDVPDVLNTAGSAVKGMRKDISQIKKSFKAIREYGKRKREIEFFAETCADIAEFEKKAISQGVFNSKSLAIPLNEVESNRFGLFFGLKLNLRDGRKYSISTMRLRRIKKFLSGS